MAVWPLVLWLSRPDVLSLCSLLPSDSRGLAYPVFDLLLLFAMGLYRRDAILEAESIPDPGAAGCRHGGRAGDPCFPDPAAAGARPRQCPAADDQAMLFGLAVVTFTLCAFLARLVIDVLVRRHVLRRRLLIVGAGQRAWDLLLMLGREGTQSARRRHAGA